MQGELIFPPSIWGARGRGSTVAAASRGLTAGRGGERAAQHHPDNREHLSSVPPRSLSISPHDKVAAESKPGGQSKPGQENTELRSKVTNLIKPSQIKYFLCRRVHLPACFGRGKPRFPVLGPDKRLQAR